MSSSFWTPIETQFHIPCHPIAIIDIMGRSGPKTPSSVPCVKKKRRIKSVSPYEKRSMRRHLTTLDTARR